jgi:replicative DNA helicase
MKLKRRKSKPKQIIKREKPQEIEDESIVIQYMIMHHNVCDAGYQYYNQGQLELNWISKPYRKIFEKVLKYYGEYGKSPKRAIGLLIRGKKSDEISLDEDMLAGIAAEYEANRKGYKISPKFIINEVMPRFIRSIKLNGILANIDTQVTRGELEKAEELLIGYERVTSEPPDITFGFTTPFSYEYHEDLFERQKDHGDEIFSFPKDAGDIRYLVGPLKRKWLVSIAGSTKSGKTYFLWEMAIRAALEQNRKVLFFSPEMTEEDMMNERFMPWLLEKPATKFGDQNYDYLPTLDCLRNQFATCPKKSKHESLAPNENRLLPLTTTIIENQVVTPEQLDANERVCRKWNTCQLCRYDKSKDYHPAVFWEKEKLGRAISSYQNTLKQTKDNLQIYAKDRTNNLKVKYFPKYLVTIEQCIESAKRYRDKHNYDFDIVIFDYLDILLLSGGNDDAPKWQKIDHIWKLASGFAQETNSLVLTGEQTTQAGRTKRLLDHTVTSEASAKDHHLNKKIGLAKVKEETKNNICRANMIYDRHRPFDRKTEVLITQDLTHANAITDSIFWRNNEMPIYPIKIPDE